MQQATCCWCSGSRCGLQQTGFNWQEFVPVAAGHPGGLRRRRNGQGPSAGRPAGGPPTPSTRAGAAWSARDLGRHDTWVAYLPDASRAAVPLIEPDQPDRRGLISRPMRSFGLVLFLP